MANKTYSKCIDSILADIEKRKNVDYADKKSVNRYNAAMKRIIENVQYINTFYPDMKSDFIGLMEHPDPRVVSVIACMIVDFLSCSAAEKRTAMSIYRQLVDSGKLGNMDRIALPLVLKKWEEKIQRIEMEE